MNQRKQKPARLAFRPPARDAREEEERLRKAREKANEYRNPPPNTQGKDAGRPGADKTEGDEEEVTTLEEWHDLISQRIEEAMRRGDFDDLRGHGKPLPADQFPNVPEDQKMAFKLLQNNQLSPDWIAERRAVLRVIEDFQAEVTKVAGEAMAAWAAANDAARQEQIAQRWTTWLVRWEDEIVEINRRITTLNLKQPIQHLEVYKLRLDDELRRVGMARTLE